MRVTEEGHPALGEHGLFAARKLAPGERCVDYLGLVTLNGNESETSDYSATFGDEHELALDAATVAWAEWLFDTGITVNTLSPGGAVDTKFGTGAVEGRGLDPRVIKKPAVWLASPASDGVTGCRYVAERWDDNLPPDEAAEGCREPVIFTPPERETPLTRAWKPTGSV